MAVFKHIFEIWQNRRFCSKNVLASKNRIFSKISYFLWFQNTLRRRMPPHPGSQIDSVMDQVGDNLVEAMELLRTFPEKSVVETGVKILARRASALKDNSVVDVFYVLANTKENVKAIDWVQLQECKTGRLLGRGYFSRPDGGGFYDRSFLARHDRAFIMNPASGKIGEAAYRNDCAVDRNDFYLRIQMQPGETLVVRVVRERAEGMGGIGFQEFESLPDWEYEEKQ